MFMALKHLKGFIWFYLQFYCISINVRNTILPPKHDNLAVFFAFM